MSKVNWNEIKLDYLANLRRKEICKKYNIKPDTLSNHIKREKWVQEKANLDQKVTNERNSILIPTLAEEQAKIITIQKKLSLTAISKLEALLNIESDKIGIKTIIEGLEKAIKMNRQAVDLPDTINVKQETTITDKTKELTKEELKKEIDKLGLSDKIFDK